MGAQPTRDCISHFQFVVAIGALLGAPAAADENRRQSGAPAAHQGIGAALRAPTLSSVRSGNWSDVDTWGGRLPEVDDIPLVAKGHEVRYDGESTMTAGVNVGPGGTLEFAPDRSCTFQCMGNVVIEGTLRMRPATPDHVHTLRFICVNEKSFVGGGMDPLDSDVGLWVMGAGNLDLFGAAKTAWTNAADSVEQGVTQLQVVDASGWQVGDTVMIVPTETPNDEGVAWDDQEGRPIDPFADKFERRKIAAIDESAVTLDEPLAHGHMAVVTDGGKKWTAEVANLTRNVRIEGTASGRAHVFVRSSVPQSLRYVEARHLGPRNQQAGNGRPQLVLGRYGLHFHHCYEGSRGTIVEGCAIYDVGNRVYVPHISHGITMRDNVAFNSGEAAFWWDFQESSHDTLWEHNLVALVSANGIDSSSVGMLLGPGDGNVACRNVVVYGHHGDPHGHGGYAWDANNEGVWEFAANLSHSNRTGLFVWQNTGLNHTVVNHESYNDFLAIFHGAYGNSYTFTGGYIYGGIVRVKATSGNTSGVRFEKVTFDGADRLTRCVDIFPSPATSGVDSNVFRECEFRNAPVALLMDTFPIASENVRKHVDLIACNFAGVGSATAFTDQSTPDSWFRIQPRSGRCLQVVHSTGTHEIEPFAPDHYGAGVGLTGRYFVGSDFDEPVFARLDPMIAFQQWSYDRDASPNGLHHLITGDAFSARWTGLIEPQFSQSYTFRLQGSGGFRLWVDDRQLIDSWEDRADNADFVESPSIELTEGKKYAIRVETFNTGGARGCQLYWMCDGLGRMVHVPQSQLFPDQTILLRRDETNRVVDSTVNAAAR